MSLALSLLLTAALAQVPEAEVEPTPEAEASAELPAAPEPAGPGTHVPPPQVAVVQLGASPDERLEAARIRIRTGDYEGARILLDQALAREGEHQEEGTYLLGVAWELGGHPDEALATYVAALERWPEGERTRDLRFRRAEATGTLGEPRRALKLLKQVGELPEPADQLKVDLVEGIWWVQAGRERKGLARLEEALAGADPGTVTFYQAKARATIAAVMVEEASELTLDASARRQLERLERRGALILGAERQITAAAQLQEPEWVLEGMLLIGQAYEDAGDALLESRVPRGLTDTQLQLYQEGLAEKVLGTWVKAFKAYDLGLNVATRLDWESRRVLALEAAQVEVRRKIEGG